VDSKTGKIYDEGVEYVSAEFSGGSMSRYKAHVYFTGSDWNAKTIIGEGVVTKENKIQTGITAGPGMLPCQRQRHLDLDLKLQDTHHGN
jgi:hypothetical protein